jgi:hypothetical protein
MNSSAIKSIQEKGGKLLFGKGHRIGTLGPATEMGRLFSLFLLSMLSLAATPLGILGACVPEDRPTRETPRELTEVWLRFHASNLCQDIDAAFAFPADRVEVRVLVEDEDSYKRLQEMLEPLRRSHRIELQATRPPEKEESDKDDDPPPSLWENYELRAYLGDPLARDREGRDSDYNPQADPLVHDTLFKYRLMAFGERILDWSKKMERYAAELPAMAQLAVDASAARELRVQASTICQAHARDLGKRIQKLEENLKLALPQSAREERRSSRPGKSTAVKDPVEAARAVSAGAHIAARRIQSFIYPEQHTVDLGELRQSSLLESLRELRSMNADFQKSLGKAVPR